MLDSQILKNSYTVDEAKTLLYNCHSQINISSAREVFYPYLFMRYQISVGKKAWSKLDKLCDCVVDLVSGSVAEGKGSPEFEDIVINDSLALRRNISEEKCLQLGHDFVLKQQLSKAKLLTPANFTIIEKELFYKRFYIMKCLDDDEKPYYVMVDAIDGGLSILDH